MNKGKILAGLDVGHVNTKTVLMKGQEILSLAIYFNMIILQERDVPS